jgi:RimJ/RimL family protein N-acetyltransferase
VREHWRRGYAYEAARTVTHYAFRDLGAAALFAGHHSDNTEHPSYLPDAV